MRLNQHRFNIVNIVKLARLRLPVLVVFTSWIVSTTLLLFVTMLFFTTLARYSPLLSNVTLVMFQDTELFSGFTRKVSSSLLFVYSATFWGSVTVWWTTIWLSVFTGTSGGKVNSRVMLLPRIAVTFVWLWTVWRQKRRCDLFSFVTKLWNKTGCLTNWSSRDHHAWSGDKSMDNELPRQLIFNRKEVIVTKTTGTSKIKAVWSCLVKYVFIVILFATADCAYKIRQQMLKK